MAGLRIGELLIQEGLITEAQLEAALTAQQVYGGRLGTNLVEQGYVNEVDLACLLGRQLGMRMVEPHQLAGIDRDVLGLVPPGLAVRYSVIPFAHDPETDRVSLAMADPTNLQKVDEIQFALGRRIDFFICPEVMLAFALEKYYGVERKRRYIRLGGVSEAELHIAPVDDGGAPRATPQATPRRGPAGSGADVLAKIVGAHDKRELVSAVLHAFSACSGQVVFFIVRGRELVAWEAKGLPLADDALRAVTLNADDSPVVAELLSGRSHRMLDRIEDDALRRTLDEGLFIDTSQPAFVLPLIVNHQVFGAFLFGQVERESFDPRVPLLLELMKRVACKLQIFYLTEYLSAPL